MQKKGLSDNVVVGLVVLATFAIVAVMGVRNSKKYRLEAEELRVQNQELRETIERIQGEDILRP